VNALHCCPSFRPGGAAGRARRFVFRASLLFVLAGEAAAQALAGIGCPVFHCNPEATTVMEQPIVRRVSVLTKNARLGTLTRQGCSGDGSRLACLFAADATTGPGRGTLKVLDSTTLQPIWGSLDAPNSMNLDPASSSGGQVPVVFADGQIAAGDATTLVRYDAAGGVTGALSLGGKGNNLGLTPVSDNFGIVSQTDGVLTLVNMATWQSVATLMLVDPVTRGRLALVSPSTATQKVLYAVAGNANTNAGYLFAVVFDQLTKRLRVRSTFPFVGKSGASPVVVSPAVSGLANDLVLLHAPGLPGDVGTHDRLLGLSDTGAGFSTLWSIDLDRALQVTPTVDETSGDLYFILGSDFHVYRHKLSTGAAVAAYDIRLMGGFPVNFALNGHLAAMQAGGQFTLLLAGAVSATPNRNGQYVIAFDPALAAPSVVWTAKVSSRADAYTGAWNVAPAADGTVYCPVVVGASSGISRVCDF
jgi:hypothetical protein